MKTGDDLFYFCMCIYGRSKEKSNFSFVDHLMEDSHQQTQILV